MKSNGTSRPRQGRDPRAGPARQRLHDRGNGGGERQRALAGRADRSRQGGRRGVTLPIAVVNATEAVGVMLIKCLVIFAIVFAIVPVLTVVERKVLGRFQARYGPNRVGPIGLMQPLADAIKLIGKEGYTPQNALPLLFAAGPALVVFSGVTVLALLPWGNVVRHLRRGGRPLRDRRLDRDPLLLRLRLVRVLRPAARRLGLRLQVQLPRRDALGGAADLLRDLDGPRPARRDHDGRHALADRDRRGAGRALVHRPAGTRLPPVHDRRLRRGQPRAVRPARGRRRARRRLPDRVRGDAVRLVHARRVHRDVRDLRDRGHLLPRRLDGARARASSTRSGSC